MNCNLKLLKARIEISPKNPHRKKEREYLFLEEEKKLRRGWNFLCDFWLNLKGVNFLNA
jgi:hypothetical protein